MSEAPRPRGRPKKLTSLPAEPKVPNKGGRKVGEAGNFVPTEDQRQIVAMAASMRMPQEDIALLIINPKTTKHVDVKTMLKIFTEELRSGYTKLRMSIHMAKVKAALEGNPTMIIWSEKTLFGVRENVDVIEPTAGDEGEDVIKKARRVAFTLALGAHQAAKNTVIDDGK